MLNWINLIKKFNGAWANLTRFIKKKELNALWFKNVFSKENTRHRFHLVSPSPWPLLASLAATSLLVGLLFWLHLIITSEPYHHPFLMGCFLVIVIMFVWFRGNMHKEVLLGLILVVVFSLQLFLTLLFKNLEERSSIILMKFFFNLIKLINHIVVNFNKKPFASSIFPIKFPTLRIFFSRLRNGPTKRQYKILTVKKLINNYFLGIYARFIQKWNFLNALTKFAPILLFFILVFISIFVSYLFFCDGIEFAEVSNYSGSYCVVSQKNIHYGILESSMIEFFTINDLWIKDFSAEVPPPINMIKIYAGVGGSAEITQFLSALKKTNVHNKDLLNFINLFNFYFINSTQNSIDSKTYIRLYLVFKKYFYENCVGTIFRPNIISKINDYKGKFDISSISAFYGYNRNAFCLSLIASLKHIKLNENGLNSDSYSFTQEGKNCIFFFLDSIAHKPDAKKYAESFITKFSGRPTWEGMTIFVSMEQDFYSMITNYHSTFKNKICDPDYMLSLNELYRHETELRQAYIYYYQMRNDRKNFRKIMYLKKYKNCDETYSILMDSFNKILGKFSFLKASFKNLQEDRPSIFWYKNYGEVLKIRRCLGFFAEHFAYDTENEQHQRFVKSVTDFYAILHKGAYSKNYYEIVQFEHDIIHFKKNFELIYAKNIRFSAKLNKEITLFEEKKK